MTSSLNSSKSSSYSLVNASRQSSYSLCGVSLVSYASDKKIAGNTPMLPNGQQVSKNSKKITSQNKSPKPEEIKSLGQKQNELIELINVLLLNDVNVLINKGEATEENIQNAKEIISNTYTKRFHPTENNQRSFIDSLQAVQKNIQEITKELIKKSSSQDAHDFTFVSENVINLTPKEAMDNFAFKKEDFKETRIQF